MKRVLSRITPETCVSLSYHLAGKHKCELLLTKTVITRKQQTLRKQEMEAILVRQQQLEETNRQLCEKAGELRRSLRDLDISQDRYQELRDLPDDKISIQEYVAVSMGKLSLISLHHQDMICSIHGDLFFLMCVLDAFL